MANVMTPGREAMDSALKEHLEKIISLSSIPSKIRVSSNNSLLLEEIHAVYSDEGRSSYIPFTITTSVISRINNLSKKINNITSYGTTEYANEIITEMDSIYAYCLQFGLLTFGFEIKVKQEIIDEFRSLLKRSKRTSIRFNDEIEKIKQSLQENGDSFLAEYKESLKSLNESAKNIEGGWSELKEKYSEETATLEKLIKSQVASIEALKEELENAKEVSNEITGHSESSAELVEEIKTLLISAKTGFDNISSHKEGVKEIEGEIKDFWNQIEEYVEKMDRTQKESVHKHTEMNNEFTKSLDKAKSESQGIVKYNQDQSKKIDELLSHAAGASLFKAFDKRREKLDSGKNFWSWGLSIFIGLGIALTIWIAIEAQQNIGVAFYVKLTAIIPIAFGIAFCAKQYSTERRAEEEYAFKSAISLSLEPYKGLLYKMRSEGMAEERQAIEKMLVEIFDNPTKRIYETASRSPERRGSDIKDIIRLLNKTDIEKLTKILETIKDIYPHG